MEKYRKFEDPTNGINPFIPEKTKKRSLLLKLLYIPQFFFGLSKFLIFFTLYFGFLIIQLFKYVLLSQKFIRLVEVFSCKLFGRIFLFLMGVWTINEKVGRIDKKRVPNIIFSSQSSIIDWMILLYRHAPKFLWIVKSEDSKSDYFTELTYYDVLLFGMGLKFLTVKGKKYKNFNIENYIIQDNHVPLVIFPECTKTNRKGVLSIRSNLMDTIYNLVNEHGRLLFRLETITKTFNYFNPNNTIQSVGLSKLFFICCQIYNSVGLMVQDIPNNNFDKNISYDRTKYNKVEECIDINLQSLLVDPNNRNLVSLKSQDHVSFLEYYNETSKDANYVKREKNEKEE